MTKGDASTTKELPRPPLKETTAEWLDAVREILQDIADRGYQERIWPGPTGPSPDNLIGDLMDGYGFDEVIRLPSLRLSDEQRAAAIQFSETLDAFGNKVGGRFDERAVLSDPDWEKVRAAADDLLKSLPS